MKPIETQYGGYRFRSRLEARWAVFFDYLKIKWYYEHEGYELELGFYLPDFYLPEMEFFIEIKPEPPDHNHCNFTEKIFDEFSRQKPFCVFGGLPGEYYGLCQCFDMTDSTAGGPLIWDKCEFVFSKELKDWAITTNNTRSERDYYLDEYFQNPIKFLIQGWDAKRLNILSRAYEKASSARFEHGENG